MSTDDSRANQTPDRQDASHDHPPLEDVLAELRELRAENQQLTTRLTELETRVDDLETERDRLAAELADHDSKIDRQTVDDLETRVDDLETTTDELTALTDATRNRTGANKDRIEELQARELEKGAHLRDTNVDVHELPLQDDHLERFTGSDGHTYYRLPNTDDPLDRTEPTLAHGDLLPIQQLARLDEDMRRSTTNSLPARLATKLWKARTDPTVGDDPWETGCKNVAEYVNASDLKHWIRRQEDGISDSYAKKLVSRTIDAVLELSKNRLAVHRTSQRKNGLSYTERRLVVPTDADIPGHDTARTSTTDTPGTSTTDTDSARTSTTDTPGTTTDTTRTSTTESSETTATDTPETTPDGSDITPETADSSDTTPETADVHGQE
ncbi:coiled-coil domain-containing protein [Natronococcus occultus]|uniref:Uncharacterized protein n=1 Tax=Natronococcus occultus SP4 TaxID=694430 RepID=L0K416_9EURY|nr:hypothetical protein [Natronococcus occultus]AGB38833.1 hypothetical protein Natoc_3090 [Natronococcus occultus SP4]